MISSCFEMIVRSQNCMVRTGGDIEAFQWTKALATTGLIRVAHMVEEAGN